MSRSSFFSTLSKVPNGNASTTYTARGTLKLASRSWHAPMTLASSVASSGASAPVITKATTT